MRLIDADLLKAAVPEVEPDSYEDCDNCDMMGDIAVRDLIDAAPTVDAVPVVRCRECVSYGVDAFGNNCCNYPEGLAFPDDNSYCCFGMRRREDKDDG